MEINNVVNHKRTLSLECSTPSDSKHFQFPEVDSAKRAFRMAVLQNTFFRKYESCAPAEPPSTHRLPSITRLEPVFHQPPSVDDRIELDLVDHRQMELVDHRYYKL